MTHDELTAARTRMGMTQTQLADAIGVSVKSYRRWEAGPEKTYGRAIPEPVARLVHIFEHGYPSEPGHE